jgi:hypothetical protein
LKQLGVDRYAHGLEGRLVADAPVGRQVKVELEGLVAADVGDRAVAERQEVLSGEAGDCHIVHAERANSRQRAADADDRLAEVDETGDLVGGEF